MDPRALVCTFTHSAVHGTQHRPFHTYAFAHYPDIKDVTEARAPERPAAWAALGDSAIPHLLTSSRFSPSQAKDLFLDPRGVALNMGAWLLCRKPESSGGRAHSCLLCLLVKGCQMPAFQELKCSGFLSLRVVYLLFIKVAILGHKTFGLFHVL